MILFLVWPKSDRDINILAPIVKELSKRHVVRIESIFNGFFYILYYRPKVLVVANFAGSILNHVVCKFAYCLGVKTVSLVSEGVIPEGLESALFWGVNKEKELFLDKYLLWNQKMFQSFQKIENDYSDRFFVVGATGFDRYFEKSPIEGNRYFNDAKSYKHVITYATWAFDLFEDMPYFNYHKDEILAHYDLNLVHRFRKDRVETSKILYQFVEKHSDCLFIIKFHPGTLYKEKTEICEQLLALKNVKVIFPEEKSDIKEIIQVSDLWLAFESTTAMEAWLMKKETIFINPSGSNFKRSQIYNGCSIVTSYEQLEEKLERFFQGRSIEVPGEIEESRSKIIKNIVGFDDGQSGKRAALEIESLLNDDIKKDDIRRKFYFPVLMVLKITVKYYMSFVVKKYSYMNGKIKIQ